MAIYTYVLRQHTQVLQAGYCEKDADTDAIAHVESLCSSAPRCTEAQLWVNNRKIFTYRPNVESTTKNDGK